ncbi:MAG: class I lanthipeptide [Telluria sp.]
MAKKIELNKQTLRELSAEEMEAVAGGVSATTTADELPMTPIGCHTSDAMATTTTLPPAPTDTTS